MTNNNNTLDFAIGNAKLDKSIATFSLPAGYTCPFAKLCLSKANRNTGEITDGKHCQFRCFSASQECTYPSVRNQRWRNLDKLNEADTSFKMSKLIQSSLPVGLSTIRPHVSGDFFNEKYFIAWLNVALNNPTKLFYGYTKALPFLIKYKDVIPANFRFTASVGGTHDYLIKQHSLRYVQVVYSLWEAKYLRLEIDHKDNCAMVGTNNFALLIHGVQPAKSDAAIAWEKLMKSGIGGYNDKRQRFGNMNKPEIPKWITYVSVSDNGKVILNNQNKKQYA
jgi:hypothetical protein